MPAMTQRGCDVKFRPLDIAIVGMGALFPGSDNVSELWRDICSGRDLITDVPPTHWLIEDHYHSDPSEPDKTYCKRGAFLSPTDFDPLEFKIPPANLSSTDTSQLLGLKVAKQVLDDVTHARLAHMQRDRISVILGVASGLELLGEMNSRVQRPIWSNALQESGIPADQASEICDRIADKYTPWKESTFPGLLGNVIAGRIASHFDLGGTNCTVDAACASSFSAMSMAINELCLGLSDLVITGGVDTTNGPFLHTCFSKTPALSPSGDCRPFSESSDGMVIGEGIGMVALKRLEDAQRDGDRIYAVVRGIGTSSDGAGQSVFAPLRQGQEKALRRCYDMAGYTPDTVELVEAHGTGTVTGDRVEFEALSQVFNHQAGKKPQWCALGSIKSQIGHTKSAAGVAGLIKTVLAVHNRILPPTIKVDQPDSRLDLANSPFYLNTIAQPWITDAAHPLRASVSAFGFGGTNFHVTIEAYQGPGRKAWKQRIFPSELILLDAKDREALGARCREISDQPPIAGMLGFLAQEGQRTFDPTSPARLAIVAEDEQDLQQKINQAMTDMANAPGKAHSPASGIHFSLSQAKSGGLAFIFPGQGSEYIGMGSDLAMQVEAVEEVWRMAAAIPMQGTNHLHDVVFPRPVFTEGEEKSQRHELSLAQWAQPGISTASLAILTLLQRLGLSPLCVGGHGSGELTAMFAAAMVDGPDLIKLTRKHGERLAGSAACDPFLEYLDAITLRPPDRPVYAGADARSYPEDTKKIRQMLVRSMGVPHRFSEVIETMYSRGVRTFVEVGPGSALTGKVRHCLGNRPHLAVNTDRKGDNGLTTFWNALGRLAIDGTAMDFSPMWEGYAPIADPRLKHKSKYSVQLLGCNYARPYPPPVEEKLPAEPEPEASDPTGRNIDIGPPAPISEPSKLESNAMTSNKKPESEYQRKPTVAVPEYISSGSQANTPTLSDSGCVPISMESDGMAAWINAFQELQRQTAQTHEAYQKSLTDSHLAYLRTAEVSTKTLGGMISGSLPHSPQIQWNETLPPVSSPGDRLPASLPDPPPVAGGREAKIGEPVIEKTEGEDLPAQRSALVDPPVPIASAHALPTTEEKKKPEGPDLKALLFEVVAEKTGYPGEVLRVEMDLESDLGIDSIKRVEILSAVNDRVPSMPEVDTAQLADLQTLADVLAYMKEVAEEQVSEALPREQPVSPPPEKRAGAEPIRYALRAAPAPHQSVPAPKQIQSGFCAVTDDGTGISHALVRSLTEKGIAAGVVAEVPDTANSVIFLGGLKACSDPATAMAVNRDAFMAAQKVSQRFSTSGGFFATVQDTGGDFGLNGVSDEIRAWLAGLPGLIKTAAMEWPQASVKAVDLQRSGRSPDELALALSRELLEGGPEIEVGLAADGTRIRLESYPTPLEQRYPRVDEHTVIVASGGARGITAAALIQLAHRFHPRIALLGRTVLDDETTWCQGAVTESDLKQVLVNEAKANGQPAAPAQIEQAARQVLANREIRSTLQALEAAGSQSCYLTADIRDPAAVQSALASVRRQWGPITGIVHGAGIINDKPITEKRLSTFDAVFNTKVLGLRSLITATLSDPLDLICLFSSVAARLGNPGQCDYAMANEVLNKVAQAQAHLREHACVVKSINWGPWEGGMVSGALKSQFDRSGIPLLPLDVGARLFVDEIQAAPTDTVEVTIVQNLDQNLRRFDNSANGNVKGICGQ